MVRDLRFAIRSLLQTRGLTFAALACLAVGIAAATTVLSTTNALLLHPVPTSDSRGLVMLAEVSPVPSSDDQNIAPANYLDLRRMSRSLARTAAFENWNVNLTGIADPERVNGVRVTPDFFSVLGERPRLGRTFTDREAMTGAAPVVVLSEPLWHRRFGGDPAVVGTSVELNGITHRIIGVMNAEFIFPEGAELWTPLALDGALGRERDGRFLSAIGRLAPGVSIGQARVEARTIAKQLEAAYPDFNHKWSMRVEPANAFYARHRRPYILMELAAVAFVLLIACANVSNLLLARAVMRGRELAVRIALGASRGQVLRAQLLETGLLAFCGGGLGVVLAAWGVTLTRGAMPAELVKFNPGWTRMGIDGPTLGFTLAVCVAVALIVGIAPALIASDVDPQHVLKEGSRSVSGRGHRMRNLLVAAEVALALVNVVGTALMVRNFRHLVDADPGYRPDHALTMTLTLPASRYASDSDLVRGFTQIVDRVRRVSGVRDAALANTLPPMWSDYHNGYYLEGQPRPKLGEPGLRMRFRIVSPSFFSTMNIALERGRLLAPTDRDGAPQVMVISEAMARALWPGQDAIGRRIISIGGQPTPTAVVGIVRDVRANPNLGDDPSAPTVYLPLGQAPYWRTMTLVARTEAAPTAMAHDIQRAINDVDHALAAGDVMTLEHMLDSSMAPQRLVSGLLAVFSVIALLLAATGIYGVTSYAVSQRTREIGVRIALGAQYADVVSYVVRGALPPVLIGLAIGFGGAFAMTRVMRAIVHEVSLSDPISFGVAVAVLAGIAVAGSYLPAWRASRVDPIVALREE